jgi:hypothetical protein
MKSAFDFLGEFMKIRQTLRIQMNQDIDDAMLVQMMLISELYRLSLKLDKIERVLLPPRQPTSPTPDPLPSQEQAADALQEGLPG